MSDRLWNISGARNYLVGAHSDLTDRLSDVAVHLPDMVGALQHRSVHLRDSADHQGEQVVHVRNMVGEVKTRSADIGGSVDQVISRSGDVRACVGNVREVVARVKQQVGHICERSEAVRHRSYTVATCSVHLQMSAAGGALRSGGVKVG